MPVQCVVSLPYTTNLPRDVSQTTWAFNTADEDGPTLNAITAALVAFYNRVNAPQTQSVSRYMSPFINRMNCSIDVYKIAEGDMGPPIFTQPFVLGAPASPTALPLEVSLCTSFQGDKITSMPQARRRGRTYIGPLNVEAINASAGAPRPNSTFINVLRTASALLHQDADAIDGVTWCVWSRTTGLLVPITNGWVNNEWDTQRRREARETDRSVWAIPEP